MSLTKTETEQLANLLRQRLQLIANHHFRDQNPQDHLQALQTISEQIDQLHHQLRLQLPARMRHYLANASYTKALAWLEDSLQNMQ